jgi:hypothetical protein
MIIIEFWRCLLFIKVKIIFKSVFWWDSYLRELFFFFFFF